MSLFTRLWTFIRRPAGYVGKDLQGNYFYEYSISTGGRTRRVVKYQGQTDTLAVVQRSRQLAVQWKAWLTHTRLHPPTLQELQADMARQERLRHNVALIEARDREERLKLTAGMSAAANPQHGLENGPLEQAALSESQVDTSTPGEHHDQAVPDVGTQSLGQARSASPSSATSPRNKERYQQQHKHKQYEHDPWVTPPASDEPQAWTPRARQRGQ